MEYAIHTGYSIPGVCDVLERRVEQIVGAKSVGMSEDRPLDKLPPDGLNEQGKIGDQRLRPKGFQGKIDAEVSVAVQVNVGVRKTDGVKSRESSSVHTNVVIQWKLLRVGLCGHCEKIPTPKNGDTHTEGFRKQK